MVRPMSDTPRTDAERMFVSDLGWVVEEKFSHELERENAELARALHRYMAASNRFFAADSDEDKGPLIDAIEEAEEKALAALAKAKP